MSEQLTKDTPGVEIQTYFVLDTHRICFYVKCIAKLGSFRGYGDFPLYMRGTKGSGDVRNFGHMGGEEYNEERGALAEGEYGVSLDDALTAFIEAETQALEGLTKSVQKAFRDVEHVRRVIGRDVAEEAAE